MARRSVSSRDHTTAERCPMSADDVVRTHVLDLLRRETERRYEQGGKDFPIPQATPRPPNVEYTPWALLEHIRIGQRDILDYVRDPHYTGLPHPQGYWPADGEQADEAAWNRSVEGFRAD